MYDVKSLRAQWRQGKTRAKVAEAYGCSWHTADRLTTLSDEDLPLRGKRNRQNTMTTPAVVDVVRKLLTDELRLKVHEKQRYTARALFHRLREEAVYQGSERAFQQMVKKVRAALGQATQQSFLPLSHPLGSQLQVDHGEVTAVFAGCKGKAFLFVATVPAEAPGEELRFCQLYPTKAQEAWGDFIERMSGYFQGIFPKILVDNDSVLIVKERPTEFSLDLQAHYGFTLQHCNKAAGWEKGSVENAVGYCRRNFLVGEPEFTGYSEANAYLVDCCTKERQSCEKKTTAIHTLRSTLAMCLPAKTWARQVDARVCKQQLVQVERQRYSVPEHFVGATMHVRISAFTIEACSEGRSIARHERAYGEPMLHINIIHYLEQLTKKPGAAQDFVANHKHSAPPLYQSLLESLQRRFPPKDAVTQWLQICALAKRLPRTCLEDAIELMLADGIANYPTIAYLATQMNTVEEKPENGDPLKTISDKLLACTIPPVNLNSYNQAIRGVLC